MKKTSRTAQISTVNEESESTLRMRKIDVTPLDTRKEDELEGKDDDVNQKYIFNVLPLQTIDLISFWLFLFLYTLFNFVYWIHYLTSY